MQKLITDLQKQNVKLDKITANNLEFYYSRLHPSDYSSALAKFYYDCAMHHFKLAQTRVDNEILINSFDLCEAECDHPDTIISLVVPDIPFILDSIKIKLSALGETINRITAAVLVITRDANQQIVKIDKFKTEELDANTKLESFLQFQLEQIPENRIKDIEKSIVESVQTIKTIVEDWQNSRAKVLQVAKLIQQNPDEDSQEAAAFLKWLENDNFAILGFCELENNQIKNDSALGIVRWLIQNNHPVDAVLARLQSKDQRPLSVSKSLQRSYTHRSDHMDNIIIQVDQRVFCLIGFLSSTSFSQSVTTIPFLQNKVDYALKKSSHRKGLHANKVLLHILENLPKEWMFQTDKELIFKTANNILNHNERRQSNVYINQDSCGHFYTAFVFVPKDIFNTALRYKIQQYLEKEFSASEVSFQVYFSDSVLTRIQFIIYTPTNNKINNEKIIADIKQISLDWNLELYKELKRHYPIDIARDIIKQYQNAFPAAYQDSYNTTHAVSDIARIEQTTEGEIKTALFKAHDEQIEQIHFKLYAKGVRVKLSDMLPMFDNMGVYVNSERPFIIKQYSADQQIALIRSIDIKRKDDEDFNLAELSSIFLKGFEAVFAGEIENDGFNQLIIQSKLDVYQSNVLRAVFKYLKQINFLYSMSFVINTLVKNHKISRLLFKLFDAKFNPKVSDNHVYFDKIRIKIMTLLGEVSSLDEDTIIRSYIEVIDAMLRSSFYQKNNRNYTSFKIKSTDISFMPKPAPAYEIFVYSSHFEGVHLRFGNIARGGLRWSDRPEDFRTEILGLVKAQQVKNTVIVPVGSKGGFVPKNLPEDRELMIKQGTECYKNFIQALLDITDNIVDDKIIKPENTITVDGDDPYLVVAADKGTATFSDTANAISEKNNFWLGDAFASGGSAGYDHKKMGITARGAWESVKRHFRELNKNIQTQDFTVIGIGDMAGDVFGNGMLLSEHIQLVAAFNHLHIFIDPNPDAASSYQERQRLFNTPGCAWSDYSKDLISKGGGIYERRAKSIILSSEAQIALGGKQDAYTPDELINLILKAKVELLWNGGIGTYVIASSESNHDAQDKANDRLRISAPELGCQVIGEGGNLGLTQLARIEYAMLGGKCYSDAIDNSAGVDSSDHEVNLKILLNLEINNGTMSVAERNTILEQMEEEVCTLCLSNNYLQTQVLSIHSKPDNHRLTDQINAINYLEASGLLDRNNEFIADDKNLKEHLTTSKCLTRPELAVLLAYSKMDLYQGLLQSDMCKDKFLVKPLLNYFPTLIQKKYSKLPIQHRLKNEIILTVVVNDLINKLGPSFHIDTNYLTGSDYIEISKAYLISHELLNIDSLFKKIQSLDNKVSTEVQYCMFEMLTKAQISNIYWILLNHKNVDIQDLLDQYQVEYQNLFEVSINRLDKGISIKKEKLTAKNVPENIAADIAIASSLHHTLDIISIANQTKNDTKKTLGYYLQVSQLLNIKWLNNEISRLAVQSTWHVKAKFSLSNQLRTIHSKITCLALSAKTFGDFESLKSLEIKGIHNTITELQEKQNTDFAMLSVLISELDRLT